MISNSIYAYTHINTFYVVALKIHHYNLVTNIWISEIAPIGIDYVYIVAYYCWGRFII